MPTDYAIKNGRTVMNATLYTGTGATQVISNADLGTTGFQPDFVWEKNRTGTNYHALFDSVRGRAYGLASNDTGAEYTSSAGNDLVSFDATGFTVGPNQNWGGLNSGSDVAWQWQAGQGTTSSNTDGSITSTVSVNASAGFSIVTFTTPSNTNTSWTVGHGLGVAPSLIITKQRGNSNQWNTYHSVLGNSAYVRLNTTGASTSSSDVWNATSPTSTVFSMGGSLGANFFDSSTTMVAYCWSEIAGYSKFGSYTGNGADDGPFVYLGFRPKWVMFKRTDTGATNWNMIDSSRDQYNPEKQYMSANTTNAEGSDVIFDFVSNGFKVRENWTDTNASGGTYIYMAFAENPFKYANAR